MTYATYLLRRQQAFAASVHTFSNLNIGDQIITLKFTDPISTPQCYIAIWNLPGVASIAHVDHGAFSSSVTSKTLSTVANGLITGVYAGALPIAHFSGTGWQEDFFAPTFTGSNWYWHGGHLEPTTGSSTQIKLRSAINIHSVGQANSWAITPGLATDRILLIAVGTNGSFTDHTLTCTLEVTEYAIFAATIFASVASLGQVSFWTMAVPQILPTPARRVSSRFLDFTQVD